MSEAASYLGVPTSTFATWARGYERRPEGRQPVMGKPLLTTVGRGALTVPFIGLAEGMVLAAFRETGLPLQRIRPALDRLRQEGELQHALASEHLFTDGAEILYGYAKAQGEKQIRLLTVVRSGQHVFHEVIEHYLTRIAYRDGWAASVTLPTTERPILVANPDVGFGQPLFAFGGARLRDVASRVGAGEPIESVADDFGVPIEDIRAALAEATSTATAA